MSVAAALLAGAAMLGQPASASALVHAPPKPKVPATIALGDSVLIDAAGVLVHLVPKMHVDAAVSRQFNTGLTIVEHLRATHRLTTRFVVFLGTNGPISPRSFVTMLHQLDRCSRVVLVTLWVPTRGWMRPNNNLIRTGPKRQHNVVLADWTALARKHRSWFYADRVHLPIDGPGATALARLIARALVVTARR